MIALNKMKPVVLSLAILLGYFAHCGRAQAGTEVALVAGGCFWCVEHDFESVPGVIGAVSGFAGGSVANPSYKQVTKGGTGHREVVEITFDNSRISYATLMDLFLRSIDPTDAGGQFCDRGQSYSSAIYANSSRQKQVAEAAIAKAAADLGRKVVTPVLGAAKFYPAEAYHQDYSRSSDVILTRFGPRSKAKAYKLYRKSCGRDTRVRSLWGSDAPFVGG